MLFVITGASASGKSAYAEQLLCRLAARDAIPHKIYMATMENEGADARERILRHHRLREGKGFATIEAPFGFCDSAVKPKAGAGVSKAPESLKSDTAVLLECTSNLLANLMFSGGMTGQAAQEAVVLQIRQAAKEYRHVVAVTNEIFSDGARYTGEMREYMCALGRINCHLAAAADAFCEIVYGIPVFLKGEEVCRF